MVKEGIQIFRDPSSIITAFIFPMLLLFLYGNGVSLDMEKIRVGIVMEDLTPLARSFVNTLSQSSYLEVHVGNNRDEMAYELSASHVRGIVIVPSQFSESLLQGNPEPQLLIIGDGSEPNTAKFVQQYVQGIWLAWKRNQPELMAQPSAAIQILPRIWYNEELKSQYFLVPGSIVVIMTITGALLTALVVAREWEKGTMEALMATPVTMLEILFSKFLAYLCMGIGSLVLCFFVAHTLYGVPFRGSFFALGLSSLAYLLYALQIGLLISSVTKNQFAASQATVVSTYLPAFILSGFIFDIDSMPLYLRILTFFVPARYFVTNLKTIFLVGDVWHVLIPNILMMLLFSALLFTRLSKRSIKRLDA